MSAPRVIEGAQGLESLVGQELGASDWLTVDQDMIEAFGRATGDEQWIHMNVERAASGPFGATIAHGFLILALIPTLANQVYEAKGFAARVNYGLERVRFPQPLRSGERVRDQVRVESVVKASAGWRVTFTHQIESETGGRPVCVAQTVILFTL